jgi:hypothetical protein
MWRLMTQSRQNELSVQQVLTQMLHGEAEHLLRDLQVANQAQDGLITQVGDCSQSVPNQCRRAG